MISQCGFCCDWSAGFTVMNLIEANVISSSNSSPLKHKAVSWVRFDFVFNSYTITKNNKLS